MYSDNCPAKFFEDTFIKRLNNRVSYNINIDVYGEKDEKLHSFSNICLAGFPSYLEKAAYTRYVWSLEEVKKAYTSLCKDLETKNITLPKMNVFMVDYYKLMREHGCLPKEMLIPKSREFKLNINISPSLFYAYVTHLRAITEEIDWVYDLMALTKEGVDFWIAYVLATALTYTNSGHGCLPFRQKGGTETIDLSYAVALKNYFGNPTKYDNRKLTYKCKYDESWKMHETIGKAKPKKDINTMLSAAIKNRRTLDSVYSDGEIPKDLRIDVGKMLREHFNKKRAAGMCLYNAIQNSNSYLHIYQTYTDVLQLKLVDGGLKPIDIIKAIGPQIQAYCFKDDLIYIKLSREALPDYYKVKVEPPKTLKWRNIPKDWGKK